MKKINNKNVAISLFGFLKSKGYYPSDYELDGFIDHDEVFSVELDEGEITYNIFLFADFKNNRYYIKIGEK
jgi:hypothetical protein